jgi:hypothetical protein
MQWDESYRIKQACQLVVQEYNDACLLLATIESIYGK